MDPVTATGVVATILQLIGTAATASSYINEIKDAPATRAQLAREVSALIPLLTDLRYRVEEARAQCKPEPWFGSLQQLSRAGGPLTQLREQLEKLNNKLHPVGESVVKRILWVVEKRDVEQTFTQLERVKSLISLALQNDHFKLSLRIKEDVQDVKQGLASAAQAREKEQESKEDNERVKILAWLSVLDSANKQQSLLDRRQPGTGEWFLQNATFKSWVDGSGERILWCPGPPGVGKSSLASLAVNTLQNHHQDKATVVTYLFCNYKEEGSQTLSNLVCELLQHILLRSKTIPDGIRGLYNKHSQRGTQPKVDDIAPILASEIRRFFQVFVVIDALDECPERDNIREGFISVLQSLPPDQVRLLCTSRHVLSIERELKNFMRLEIKSTDEDIRLYLAGRIDGDISPWKRRLLASPGLREEIIEKITAKAQGMFLLAQLHMESLSRKLNSRDIRAALAALPKRIDDTYDQAMERIKNQYEEEAQLALSVLSWIIFSFRTLTVVELQQALAVQLGDRELDREGMSDEESILSVCAGLVTVDQESGTIRLVHYTAQQYFEREDIRQHVFQHAPALIAETCLTYLLFTPFSERICTLTHQLERWIKEYPFFEYTVSYWGDHARISMGDTTNDLAWRFLNNPFCLVNCKAGLNKRTHIFNSSVTWNRRELAAKHGLVDITRRFLEENQNQRQPELVVLRGPLIAAAEAGHADIVRLLLDKGALASSVDCQPADALRYFPNPLVEAIRGARLSIVQIVLEAIDMEAERKPDDLVYECYGRAFPNARAAALYYAADYNQLEIMEWLVENGADVSGGNPSFLEAAVRSGSIRCLEFLVQQGAELSGVYLHQAISCNQFDMAKLLISKGVDISVRCDQDRTVLHTTAKALGSLPAESVYNMSHLRELLRLFIEKGLDLNERDGDMKTPVDYIRRALRYVPVDILFEFEPRELSPAAVIFETAIKTDDHMAVSELARNGTSVHNLRIPWVKDRQRTSLHYAVSAKATRVMKLLLDQGADVDAQSEGYTALHLAIITNYEEGVRLLLEYGASASTTVAKHFRGGAPLHLASAYGSVSIMGLLMKQPGTALEAVNDEGETPLLYALAINGDPWRHGNRGRELCALSLYLASQRPVDAWVTSKDIEEDETGWMSRVDYLLEKGANILVSNAMGETVLKYAAGCPKVLEKCLARGVDPNEPARGPGVTPLYWALRCASYDDPNLDSARLLLDYGADVNMSVPEGTDGRTNTPLGFTVDDSKTELARLLLDRGADIALKVSSRQDRTSESSESILRRAVGNTSDHFREGVANAFAVVDILIEYGADLNALEEVGGYRHTMLHYAIAMPLGHILMVNHLIVRGAELEAKDSNGKTPLDLAQETNNDLLVMLIEAYLERKRRGEDFVMPVQKRG